MSVHFLLLRRCPVPARRDSIGLCATRIDGELAIVEQFRADQCFVAVCQGDCDQTCLSQKQFRTFEKEFLLLAAIREFDDIDTDQF